MTKEALIKKLGAFPLPAPKILVDDQDVNDIIEGVLQKHKDCVKHYDVIFKMFDADGSWWDVGQRLYDFCTQQIEYSIEKVDWQYVSTPATILKRGYSDCKGYALFCAGVVDAMRRNGEKVDWCYRFASYNLFKRTPGHVFVVINPGTDNIWLDPVIGTFNGRYPSPIWKIDRRVSTCRSTSVSGIGWAPGMEIRKKKIAAVGSAEQSLLDSIETYSEGTNDAITLAIGNGVLNTICLVVLATASVAVPLIAAALAIVKIGAVAVSDAFGPGSEAAMLVNDFASNPLTAPVTIVETLLNGRTYNSDQYRAAQFYQFYVLGNKSINGLNKVSDAMVPPALKWFIDRLGVFVSGAEHIIGLTVSPGDYMSYYGVNNYTTMDQNRVDAASNVASTYFIMNNVAGSWANTVGVYDLAIAQIAQQNNETVEAAAAQANYQGVYSAAATNGPAPVDNGGMSFPVIPVLLAAAAGIFLIMPSKK